MPPIAGLLGSKAVGLVSKIDNSRRWVWLAPVLGFSHVFHTPCSEGRNLRQSVALRASRILYAATSYLADARSATTSRQVRPPLARGSCHPESLPNARPAQTSALQGQPSRCWRAPSPRICRLMRSIRPWTLLRACPAY